MVGALNNLVYVLAFIGSMLSGILMFDGLLTREEKRRRFLMTKRRLKAFQVQAKDKAITEELDSILRYAGNPLGLNAFRYQLIRYSIIISMFVYYFLLPLIVKHEFNYWTVVITIVLVVSSSTRLPYSLFAFIIKKVTTIYESRKNNEIFQLHDLLISEFELMESRQVNTYHILKRLYKNFEHIQPELQELLVPSNWKEDPRPAFERFANSINTPEAHMLVNILSKFDKHTNRDVAISSLESNAELFATKQIENYRTRRKLINDLALIPVFFTHILVMAIFMGVIVILTMQAFNQSNL